MFIPYKIKIWIAFIKRKLHAESSPILNNFIPKMRIGYKSFASITEIEKKSGVSKFIGL